MSFGLAWLAGVILLASLRSTGLKVVRRVRRVASFMKWSVSFEGAPSFLISDLAAEAAAVWRLD